MILTKLKAKNQLTLPQAVVERLHLHPNEFFQLDIKHNCIMLIPVTIEPRYTAEELDKLDALIAREKGKEKRLTRKFIDNLKKGKI